MPKTNVKGTEHAALMTDAELYDVDTGRDVNGRIFNISTIGGGACFPGR